MPDKNRKPPPQPDLAAWEAPPANPYVAGLDRRVAELQATVDQIQAAMQQWNQLMHHPPMHLTMERLEVQHLVFHFDTIHVDELGGELNIGLTQMFKPGQGGQPATSGSGDEATGTAPSTPPQPTQPTPVPPLPPIAGGSPASRRPPRATLPGSVISRWLHEGPPKKSPHPPATPPGDVAAAAIPSPPKEWPIWPPPEEVEGEP